MSNPALAVRFLLQMATILAACRGVGIVARRFGQPSVAAEMIAGVLLGPSVLGLGLPDVHRYLFPGESQYLLFVVSQVGITLYMFLVGVEFRTDLFLTHVRAAAAISIAGMLVPFALGLTVAWWLTQSPGVFFTDVAHGWDGAAFLGASMCVTAFPMLARILGEQGLSGTVLGTLSLAAGAMGDAVAWCLLVVTLSSAETMSAFPMIGAFMLGCAMPRGLSDRGLMTRAVPLTAAVLTPAFFAYSGLHTRLDLVDSPYLWFVTAVVLLAACVGKWGGCWAAARLTGEEPRTALAIGVLMNARGMMGLIIVNVGLARGIITPTLFSIMVVMAIVTTLMTTPLLRRLYPVQALARPS